MYDHWVLFYEEKMFTMLDYVVFGFIFPLVFFFWLTALVLFSLFRLKGETHGIYIILILLLCFFVSH